ncbi:hypothetical protein NC653_030415 [Populus alba x Populus x berolinensis]|uniref:Protein kinase domain-containing protein n=1 Tax=Populus alba x Populus x berolinensis TaxID=444605 RepID=A0AAD6LW91_9ROSI|nr:hypothetical protein NC653_030415 [Populus alba x Populus x berolinensis]
MVLEDGIVKTKKIMEGNQEVNFTIEEYQRCVFDLHSASYRNNSHWLLERFVFKEFYVKFQDVAISLINQERMGLHIDCSSLKNVFLLFMEMHKHTGIAYYEGFESVLLEETSNYYCQMAQQWLSLGSPADYVQKVYQCLEQEAERAERYMLSGTPPKLLKVVKQQLVYEILDKLVEKQRPENCGLVTDFYQEMLSKCANMTLQEGSSWTTEEWLSALLTSSLETGVGFLVAAGVHKLFILVPDLAMHRIGGMSTCWETKKDKKANKETAFIKNGSKLLEKLVDICDGKCNSLRMDMANAVAFLHVAFAKPIVFRNIKPLNILLDDNHGAKLSDFSISISIPKGESHVRDSVAGATGLIAPEYLTTGNFNEKQDVFNFGVFLLVLLSGQMVVDFSRPEKEILLQDHVKKCIEDDRFNKVIDSTIIAEGTWPGKEQQLQAYTALSLRCISELAEDRPTMVDVSQELRKIYWSAISCRQQ